MESKILIQQVPIYMCIFYYESKLQLSKIMSPQLKSESLEHSNEMEIEIKIGG